MSEIIPSAAQQERDRSKSQHITALAAELLDDIELNRLPAEALLLKAMRLARFYGASEEIRSWLTRELMGGDYRKSRMRRLQS